MIYLDNQATTACDPRVVEAMLPYFTEEFGNSSSVSHSFGNRALQAVNLAKERIAGLIGASDPNCIYFTSGATESNNIAIKSLVTKVPADHHIITTATEHKAVLDPFEYLENLGVQTSILPVDEHGCVNPQELNSQINDRTSLATVLYANNEVGSINPISEIADACRNKNVTFHTDATQAIGKTAIHVEEQGIDMLSLSGHKIYGPKGIGVLYVRKRGRGLRMTPLLHGGGHQNKIRSGTLPVPLIVGLGKACELLTNEHEAVNNQINELATKLKVGLTERIPEVIFNGHPTNRIAGNLHLTIPEINSEALLYSLKDTVALSTGSACTTAAPEPSHVLQAMGINRELISQSVRIGIGRFNTEQEVDTVIDAIVKAVAEIKAF